MTRNEIVDVKSCYEKQLEIMYGTDRDPHRSLREVFCSVQVYPNTGLNILSGRGKMKTV